MSQVRRFLEEYSSSQIESHEYGGHGGHSLSQRDMDSNCWSISDSQPVHIQSQDPQCAYERAKNAVQTNEVLLEISRVDDHLYEHVDTCRKDIDMLKNVLTKFTRQKRPSESAVEKHLKKMIEGNDRLHDICRRSLCATLDISRSLEIKLQKMDAILESMTGICVPGSINGTPPTVSLHSGYSDPSSLAPNSPLEIISSSTTIDEQESVNLNQQSTSHTPLPSQSKEATGISENPKNGGKLFCVCKRPQFGKMIACENAECQFEWFHFRCVGLKKSPEGTWYCSDCTNRTKVSAGARKKRSTCEAMKRKSMKSRSMKSKIPGSYRYLRSQASK